MWRRTEPSTFWYILIQHRTECYPFLQVFGEALLNDGVTFVLYEGVKELAFVEYDNIEDISVPGQTSSDENFNFLQVLSYIYVVLSFFTAPLGGFLVGFLAGLMAALVTKYTNERDEYLKPILNLLFACLAYMLTLVFGFSNILGLIAYGIAQTRYGVGNMRRVQSAFPFLLIFFHPVPRRTA